MDGLVYGLAKQKLNNFIHFMFQYIFAKRKTITYQM